jgi:nucleoside-diphosphate kinase
MPIERTLSIIKPDATRRNLTGAINDRFEKAGLRIIAQKRMRLSQDTAGSTRSTPRGRSTTTSSAL